MDEVDEEYLLLVLLLRRRRKRMRKIVGNARAKHKFWIRNIYRNNTWALVPKMQYENRISSEHS